MYFRRKTSAGRAYLQIVESRRDGDQVRQHRLPAALQRLFWSRLPIQHNTLIKIQLQLRRMR